MPRKIGTEFLGTFFITIVAIGVDVAYYSGGHADYVSRWLARGFITTAMIYAFSAVSGAHLDPAVSLGFTLRKDMPLWEMLLYWLGQFAGGAAAALLGFALWKGALVNGASHPGPQYTQFEAAICEVILTFLLVLVILATTQAPATVGKQAGHVVGYTVAACGFFAGPISGASMNPARSIPSQLLAGVPGISWIYLVGPLVGAALAALVAGWLFGPSDESEKTAARGG